ncbi:prolipoprotein diacylglyceryl transferase [Mycoplasmopsis mustelae]|uniref:Phosphatidylglycerol--prolipoprotein diacylglyceryl transferase n=1 Tax=Mycoplasmopsis mustelae TaxID=171289 RepID=A0A4R7UCE0_9BACT|nr:prolipoprotein diacylglyceryl transferase [Mycoplasmopsis mustelae]TDV24092.1 prolipoprotein diacylglyceryl transferase [Mycoplasmopsis mustelae]
MNSADFIPAVAYREGVPAFPLFKINSFEVQIYSLMIMLGYLASILTILFFWKREKLNMDKLYVLILITIPMGILGSRFGYMVEQWIYAPIPFRGSAWWKIWEGGLSIQGGLILTIIVDLWYVYTQRKHLDIRKAASIIIPTILIGQFVGRWGNYANHEVYGKIDWSGNSVLVFGQSFASNMYISDALTDQLGLAGAYRYPLFLYEGLANLIGYILIVWVVNYFGIFKPGTSVGLYLLWYGLLRMAMEPLREEAYGLYQYVALGFVLVGALLFVYYQFWNKVKYNVTIKHKVFKFYSYADEDSYLKYVAATSFSHIFKKLYSYAWFK